MIWPSIIERCAGSNPARRAFLVVREMGWCIIKFVAAFGLQPDRCTRDFHVWGRHTTGFITWALMVPLSWVLVSHSSIACREPGRQAVVHSCRGLRRTVVHRRSHTISAEDHLAASLALPLSSHAMHSRYGNLMAASLAWRLGTHMIWRWDASLWL